MALRTKTLKTIRSIRPKLPYYTADSVLVLFQSNDPRIVLNDYGTSKCIQLADDEGYFKFSDDDGGIAKFYAGDTDIQLFTAAIEITDEMRQAKCSGGEGCGCNAQWFELLNNCTCTEHHDGPNDVVPRIELCSLSECDGKHAHLIGLCYECYNSGLIDGIAPEAIRGDGFRIQLR